jgi:hypothetical protein
MWSTIVKADYHQQLPQQIGSPLLAKMVPLRLGEKSPEPLEQVTKLIYDFVRSSESSYFSGCAPSALFFVPGHFQVRSRMSMTLIETLRPGSFEPKL